MIETNFEQLRRWRSFINHFIESIRQFIWVSCFLDWDACGEVGVGVSTSEKTPRSSFVWIKTRGAGAGDLLSPKVRSSGSQNTTGLRLRGLGP